LKARGETIDACIVGEPSNPNALGDEIKIGRRGSLTAEIVVHGRQGHAAYPQKADNPIPKLARILDRLSSAEIHRGTAHLAPSNLQVTVLSVPNRASNVIPAEARATPTTRANDTWRRPPPGAWGREQCAAAAASLGASSDIAFAGTGAGFLTSPGPLVETLSAAGEAETG